LPVAVSMNALWFCRLHNISHDASCPICLLCIKHYSKVSLIANAKP